MLRRKQDAMGAAGAAMPQDSKSVRRRGDETEGRAGEAERNWDAGERWRVNKS